MTGATNKENRWIAKNFGKLVDLYGGRYVAVSGGRVMGVGVKPETAERQARSAGCRGCPAVVRVPSPERVDQVLDPFRLFRFS